MKEPCEHHHCTPSSFYGGRNPLVVQQHGEQPVDARYRGFICCKCHHVQTVPQGLILELPGDDCRKRWEEWEKEVDAAFFAEHGLLGP